MEFALVFQVLEMQAASNAVLSLDIGPISTSQLQVIFPDQGASEVAMVASQLGRSPTSAITWRCRTRQMGEFCTQWPWQLRTSLRLLRIRLQDVLLKASKLDGEIGITVMRFRWTTAISRVRNTTEAKSSVPYSFCWALFLVLGAASQSRETVFWL